MDSLKTIRFNGFGKKQGRLKQALSLPIGCSTPCHSEIKGWPGLGSGFYFSSHFFTSSGYLGEALSLFQPSLSLLRNSLSSLRTAYP